jgi:hypothetical protein
MTAAQKQFQAQLNRAWPDERLAKLGLQQGKLLEEFVAMKDDWTDEELSNLLLEVETYWPEEIIPICRRAWNSLPANKDEKPKAHKGKGKKCQP